MKWCLTNTGVQTDCNGNIVPIKNQSPKQRIDGTAALLDCYVGFMSITTNTQTQFKGGDDMKLKDKKIEILQQVTVKDNEGFSTTTLDPIAPPLWGYFQQLSGKEVFAAATTNYKEEIRFVINHRTDLTTAHAVRYNGILYDITRIDTFEGYKEDITLYCSRRARQS